MAGCSSSTDAIVPPPVNPNLKPQYLWVALGSGAVVELSPVQLTQSGTPSLASFTIPNQSINGKTTVDSAGSLWVSDGYGYMHAYTASQLAQVSSAGGSMTPAVTLAIGHDGAVPLTHRAICGSPIHPTPSRCSVQARCSSSRKILNQARARS